ncbi:MAG: hypothetical protein methR_P1461 [Methyloprofundus sp.]|nr:MAG: hypothetical protein methR_P1461 [Methyloprofundus sp.]
MKKIFLYLLLGLFAMQVNASTLTLGVDGANGSFFDPLPFDIHTLELVDTLGGNPSWNVSFAIQDLDANSFSGFGATVKDSSDVTVLTLNGNGDGTVSPGIELMLGTYTIEFFGSAGGDSTSANMLVSISEVSQVPLPAAAWLMGSALVGLVSFGRRKTELAA